MNSEKIAYNLLSTSAALIAVVPVARIFAGLIPLRATLPAIAYSHVSTTQETTVAMTTQKVRSRVQITVATKTYPELKNIIALVKSACNNKQGTFNGVVTDSVILDNVGADFRDDNAGIFYQTIDIRLTYND